MSAFSHRLIEFPSAAARPERNASGINKIAGLVPPKAIAHPVLPVAKQGYYGRSLTIAAALALSLHAGLLMLPEAQQPEPAITPPVPIQVQWLSNPAQAETPPAPAKPAEVKPAPKKTPIKPKPVKKAVHQAKPLLTSRAGQPQLPDLPAHAEPAVESPAQPVKEASPPAAQASAEPAEKARTQAPDSLPHLNAAYLNNPAPNYPPESRNLGEQGKVLVKALVDPQGHVAELSVRKTSGYPRLDQAALNSVKNWKFVPAQRNGENVAAWVLVPVLFDLEG